MKEILGVASLPCPGCSRIYDFYWHGGRGRDGCGGEGGCGKEHRAYLINIFGWMYFSMILFVFPHFIFTFIVSETFALRTFDSVWHW